VSHPFHDPIETRQDAAHDDLGGDELSERQLPDAQEPTGRRNQPAVRDRLPSE
jgi:hypothetical protein